MLISIEDGAAGGFAAHVMQFMALDGLLENGLKFRPMTLPDIFIDQDKPELQYDAGRPERQAHRRDGAERARPVEGSGGGGARLSDAPHPDPLPRERVRAQRAGEECRRQPEAVAGCASTSCSSIAGSPRAARGRRR